MNEKVLGFYEKDAVNILEENPKRRIKTIPEDMLVPVRLRSESVSVAWLELEIKKRVKRAILESGSDEWNTSEYDSGVENGIKEACNDLLLAVRCEAKKK